MITAETYCDCQHRRSVHYSMTLRDIHGDVVTWAGVAKCALAGCACLAFTQEAQRKAAQAGQDDAA